MFKDIKYVYYQFKLSRLIMKKIILSIMVLITSCVLAETNADCDSNCMNGVNMTESNNSVTGTQMTTTKGFSYFTGTTCNGYNLMNNFSNGSQTIKESNSSTCGYVAPAYVDNSSSNDGGLLYFNPDTGLYGTASGQTYTADQATQYFGNNVNYQVLDCINGGC
jgi:hypothetical protein